MVLGVPSPQSIPPPGPWEGGCSWQSSSSRSQQPSPWVTSWRSSSLPCVFTEGDRLLNLDARIQVCKHPAPRFRCCGAQLFISPAPEGHPHPPGCSVGFGALFFFLFPPPLFFFPAGKGYSGRLSSRGARGSAPGCKTGKILKPREGCEDECADACEAFNTVMRGTGERLRRR